MDLITKDLSTFSSFNLQILARYFGIPARIEQQELTKLLSQSIYHKYYAKARFPGEYKSRGEIMQAMARREISRAEGMKLLKEFKAAPQPKPTSDCDVPEKYQICANDKDYLSQECWSDNYAPSLKIKFLDPNDYSKKPFVLCMQGKDFYEMYQNAQAFAAWVEKPGVKLEPEGYGGKPLPREQYVKIFEYFIANDRSEIRSNINGDYTAYPLETQKRLGNLRGQFGVSELHGQAPGFTTYYLIKDSEPEVVIKDKLVMELTRKDLTNQYLIDNLDDKLSIKEMLAYLTAVGYCSNDIDIVNGNEWSSFYRPGITIIFNNPDSTKEAFCLKYITDMTNDLCGYNKYCTVSGKLVLNSDIPGKSLQNAYPTKYDGDDVIYKLVDYNATVNADLVYKLMQSNIIKNQYKNFNELLAAAIDYMKKVGPYDSGGDYIEMRVQLGINDAADTISIGFVYEDPIRYHLLAYSYDEDGDEYESESVVDDINVKGVLEFAEEEFAGEININNIAIYNELDIDNNIFDWKLVDKIAKKYENDVPQLFKDIFSQNGYI